MQVRDPWFAALRENGEECLILSSSAAARTHSASESCPPISSVNGRSNTAARLVRRHTETATRFTRMAPSVTPRGATLAGKNGAGAPSSSLAEAAVSQEPPESGTRKGLGMHRGRHTVATEILRGSGNIVAAQKMLGHADLSTTERDYASFDTEDVDAVLRQIRGLGAE